MFMPCPGNRPLAANRRVSKRYRQFVNNVAGIHSHPPVFQHYKKGHPEVAFSVRAVCNQNTVVVVFEQVSVPASHTWWV